MKIIDCFTFYNEFDLLNYRFELLNDYVDYFVLVEGTKTFVGLDKPLLFAENKDKFKKFEDKIIYVLADEFPFSTETRNNNQWYNEFYQRNCIDIGLKSLNLDNNDIVLISDVDEFPDLNVLQAIKNNKFTVDKVYSLEQDFYYYNFNCKKKHKWYHAKILPYAEYMKSNVPNDIRLAKVPYIQNGGWHLSYFGSPEFIKNKILNFSHQEFNSEFYSDVEKIESRIKRKVDLFERPEEYCIANDFSYMPNNYNLYLGDYL